MTYLETRIDYQQIMEIPDGEGTTNSYLSTYIMMDEAYRETTRNTNNFMMAFSDTGGFMTIIYMIIYFVI